MPQQRKKPYQKNLLPVMRNRIEKITAEFINEKKLSDKGFKVVIDWPLWRSRLRVWLLPERSRVLYPASSLGFCPKNWSPF